MNQTAFIFIEFIFFIKKLTAYTVKASVGFFVNIASGVTAAPYFLSCSLMLVTRGANKRIIRKVEGFFQGIEPSSKMINVFLSIFTFSISLLSNFLAMFVGAGIEKDFVTE